MRTIRMIMVPAFAVFLLLLSACGETATDAETPTGAATGTGDQVATGEAPGGRSIQGFNFPAWWHDDYMQDSALHSLDRLAATGADWVAVVPTQYMADGTSFDIAPESGGRTVTDASVMKIIAAAHERGLKVMLKPHVDVQEDIWRGDIMPADTGAWFDSYREMISAYARMAEATDVELFCIGTEFASMEGPEYHDEWLEVIDDVRRVYGGELTYAASLNSFESITFWDSLDYLGLDFYFPLSDAASPSLEELIAGWTDYSGFYGEEQDWLSRIEIWQEQWGIPVIFTEIGYRSIDYAARAPWEYESTGAFNGRLQADAYLAAFEMLGDKPWFAGMFWWSWAARGDGCGPGNTGYDICGKPAEETVTRIFSGGDPESG